MISRHGHMASCPEPLGVPWPYGLKVTSLDSKQHLAALHAFCWSLSARDDSEQQPFGRLKPLKL